MSELTWKGVYPAVLTPFDANYEIDFDMFAKNTEAQIAAGVHGIILAGSLGEASTLSREEKFLLLEKGLEIVNGRIPVIMGLSESTTKDAQAFASDAERRGANGLMALPPMRYRADNREVVAYFQAIAQSSSLSLMIYNNPVDYSTYVTLDMFEQLLEEPTIQAVKESTRDLTNVVRLKNRFGDRLKVLGGVDTISLESLLLEADGLVAGLVDAFPKETVALYDLAQAGKYKKAVELYRWFMPLLELDIHPKLVQYIKLAATAEGIGTPHVRAPRLPLVGEEKERISKIIEDAIASRPNISKYDRADLLK